MTTKAIFTIDKKLKQAAMKKARKHGTTLSAVLNHATRAYVDNQFALDPFAAMIAKAREEIRQGKGIPQEEVFRRLGL